MIRGRGAITARAEMAGRDKGRYRVPIGTRTRTCDQFTADIALHFGYEHPELFYKFVWPTVGANHQLSNDQLLCKLLVVGNHERCG